MCFNAQRTAKALEGLNERCIFKCCQRCFLLYSLGEKRPVALHSPGPTGSRPTALGAHSRHPVPQVKVRQLHLSLISTAEGIPRGPRAFFWLGCFYTHSISALQ